MKALPLSVILLCLSPGQAQSRQEGKQVTAQAVVETLFKTLNKTHSFTIKDSVEYYVKFTVPQKIIKKLQNEKDKHIFQVSAMKGLTIGVKLCVLSGEREEGGDGGGQLGGRDGPAAGAADRLPDPHRGQERGKVRTDLGMMESENFATSYDRWS